LSKLKRGRARLERVMNVNFSCLPFFFLLSSFFFLLSSFYFLSFFLFFSLFISFLSFFPNQMGQHMCASPVMSKVYVDVLRVLMDNAVPRSMEETEQTWRDEFGVEIRDQFAEFDDNPIATASLAQVYRARLNDGRKVAVKVQHRDVARLFKVDMGILSVYYKAVSWFLPVSASLPFLFLLL